MLLLSPKLLSDSSQNSSPLQSSLLPWALSFQNLLELFKEHQFYTTISLYANAFLWFLHCFHLFWKRFQEYWTTFSSAPFVIFSPLSSDFSRSVLYSQFVLLACLFYRLWHNDILPSLVFLLFLLAIFVACLVCFCLLPFVFLFLT